jgi:hypothetical protein
MLIDPTDAELFIKLYISLIGYAAGRTGSVAGIHDVASFESALTTDQIKARDHLLQNIHLIHDYIESNPDGFREQQLSHVFQWTCFLQGDFIVERDLKSYTVFLTAGKSTKAYGVLGLTEEITELLPIPMPALTNAVLFPWKSRIVWDGIFCCRNMYFGGGIRREFQESYRQAKKSGIILSMDPDWKPLPSKPPSKPKTSAISRFLKKCPKTLEEFKSMYGPPRFEMLNDAAREYCLWSMDGKPAIDIDTLLIYANILRKQVLYVYGKAGKITHMAVVHPTPWSRKDFKPYDNPKLRSLVGE